MSFLKIAVLLSAFVTSSINAQVTYVAGTSQSCANVKEPVVKLEFKANVEKQIVIYTFER
jgi:hypothetical protein